MASFTGSITIPFDIEYASTPERAEMIINSVLDTFGQHDFKHLSFTWDNPEWTIHEEEDLDKCRLGCVCSDKEIVNG